jgi:ribulose-phosphate 3-epimerase
MKLSASIIATSLTALSTTLPKYDKNWIDYIHLDVMDGNFVPQITFGEGLSKEVASLTNIPLDVHLMVSNPEREVPKYYDIKPAFLTFHAETTDFMVRLCDEIRSRGIKAGVSLNPATPLEKIESILPYVDLVLLMTVDPGFYGQAFFKGGFDKIKKAKDMFSKFDHPILLEVDGGVNSENIAKLSQLGVDICVTGSALYKGSDPNSRAVSLKNLTV